MGQNLILNMNDHGFVVSDCSTVYFLFLTSCRLPRVLLMCWNWLPFPRSGVCLQQDGVQGAWLLAEWSQRHESNWCRVSAGYGLETEDSSTHHSPRQGWAGCRWFHRQAGNVILNIDLSLCSCLCRRIKSPLPYTWHLTGSSFGVWRHHHRWGQFWIQGHNSKSSTVTYTFQVCLYLRMWKTYTCIYVQRRCGSLKEKGLLFVGSGVSGGEEGARYGPSLMPGGHKEAWWELYSFSYMFSNHFSVITDEFTFTWTGHT